VLSVSPLRRRLLADEPAFRVRSTPSIFVFSKRIRKNPLKKEKKKEEKEKRLPKLVSHPFVHPLYHI
jgi:hypothetical protein